MWIIFEGLDKSGKTTLEWELLKATNFKHIVIDRGPIGYMVFDEIFGRSFKPHNKWLINQAKNVTTSESFLVVYCKAPYDIVQERLDSHNEICPYNYSFAQNLYDDYINYYNTKRVITIDTSESIDICIDKIVEKLREVLECEL